MNNNLRLHVILKRCYSNRAKAQPNFYQNKMLDQYTQPATPLTLRQLMFYERHINPERLLKSANYVRTELPIRIAHRIREFQKLPYLLGTNPHIEAVYGLYWQAFDRIRHIPTITSLEANQEFCRVLEESLDGHLVVIPQLAKGINECQQHPQSLISIDQLDQFMNDTLRSRISRRVLAEHHLVLSSRRPSIFNVCRSRELMEKCIGMVEADQGIRLEVEWEGVDAEFDYVSDHVEYIFYQVLSNAYRHSGQSGRPIRITLCSNRQDVLFRISDQAGGMTKECFDQVWSYGSSRRFGNMEHVQTLEAKVEERGQIALRLGIGLPMSRVYAEYWGGDIQLVTMEGYGTDAYVRIPRLGTQNENIKVHSLDEVIM